MPLIRDKAVVPALMFHSVGDINPSWIWSELTESVETFEQIIAGLAARDFVTVSLQELFDYMAGLSELRDNSILLTFDDGYLDNWVYAVPILRKYGMRATVYVTPDFVENAEITRASTDDKDFGENPESFGFMNWAELKKANDEGILDVQSHGLTHTWHYSGPKIVDFHCPEQLYRYPWLSWNADPARKPFYLTENQQDFVPWGHPIFEHEKSLIVRKFVPDDSLVREIVEFVASNGAAEYFNSHDWRSVLERKFSKLRPNSRFPGEYESEQDYLDRVSHELVESKRILETKLEKKIDFMSWPGGGNSNTTIKLARDAGYKSWTLSSWQAITKKNIANVDASGIKRISANSNVFLNEKIIANGGADWVIDRILTNQGSSISRLRGAIKKIMWAIRMASSSNTRRTV